MLEEIFESTALRECLTTAVVYGAVCMVLHGLAVALVPFCIPGFAKMTEETRNSFPNRLVASFHAGLMALRSMTYWTTLNVAREIPLTVGSYEARTIDVMIGYLLYDTIFEFFGESSGWIMMIHHVLGLMSHLSTRIYDSGPAAFYSMMVYLAETSTPLLHGSWVFKQLGPKYSAMMYTSGALLLLAFLVFRVVLGPFLMFHMWQFWPEGSPILFNINLVIVVMFAAMNMHWFRLLLLMFFKKDKKEKKKGN